MGREPRRWPCRATSRHLRFPVHSSVRRDVRPVSVVALHSYIDCFICYIRTKLVNPTHRFCRRVPVRRRTCGTKYSGRAKQQPTPAKLTGKDSASSSSRACVPASYRRRNACLYHVISSQCAPPLTNALGSSMTRTVQGAARQRGSHFRRIRANPCLPRVACVMRGATTPSRASCIVSDPPTSPSVAVCPSKSRSRSLLVTSKFGVGCCHRKIPNARATGPMAHGLQPHIGS